MPYRTVRLTDGTPVEFDDSPIGSGAEKIVFFTRDRRQVLCFYLKGLTDRQRRRGRLDKILKEFNPTVGKHADFWKGHFCWPVGITDGDGSIGADFFVTHNVLSPPMAVLAPAYPSNFVFKDKTGSTREKDGRWFTGEKARKRLPPGEKGNFLGYLRVCAKMARAVRKLHMTGLAHSDLSNKNVLIDPSKGDACIIDIDSLVVPGVAPPSVLGTPGYIAPEIVAGRKTPRGEAYLPCIDTDCYALGVLIYECLLLRHPIARQRPVQSGISPEEDERLAMGEKALFVEHPSDRTNWRHPPPLVPIERLGPHLARLFLKLFIEGLHDRSQRPGAGEWESALYATLDLIHPSPDQSEWFVLGPNMPMQCPITRKRLTQAVPFAKFYSESRPGLIVDEKRTLTIWNGLRLMKWHTTAKYLPNENADNTVQGCFMLHQGKWIMVNQTDDSMSTRDGRVLAPRQAVEIKPGLQVRASGRPDARTLFFDFMRPPSIT